MPFDISALLRSPDIRDIDPARARLVGALRYCHVARCAETYCPNRLGQHLGCRAAVASFHVLLDEMGRAWPEPIALNRPCNPRLSYDETLITDLCMAAMRGDRGGFDEMTHDMLGHSARNAIWSSCTRLMRHLTPVPE